MNVRAILLPLFALLTSVGLIWVHVASGGDDYGPASPPDPCRIPALVATTDDLETITEALVVDGVRDAACTLGVTRERLVLALPSEGDRRALVDDDALAAALRLGLRRSVDRLERGGRLPKASALRDDYVDELGLPGIAEAVVRRIPDGVVDDLLPTGAVLRRALGQVDLLAVIAEIDEPDALERRLRADIEDAAKAEARDRLIARIPRPVRRITGIG